jgi:8-oxo-dGTP pyrophosphatase MutT (NUDIX family)
MAKPYTLSDFISTAIVFDEEIRQKHQALFSSGNYLRETKSPEHFCVYFGGIDLKSKKVFLGHHRKANLWLFNGGHLEPDETIETTIVREAGEEWGVPVLPDQILELHALTITPINNPLQPNCSAHYDLWNFVALDENSFSPDQQKLDTEFFSAKWFSLEEAKQQETDRNTPLLLDLLGQKL